MKYYVEYIFVKSTSDDLVERGKFSPNSQNPIFHQEISKRTAKVETNGFNKDNSRDRCPPQPFRSQLTKYSQLLIVFHKTQSISNFNKFHYVQIVTTGPPK